MPTYTATVYRKDRPNTTVFSQYDWMELLADLTGYRLDTEHPVVRVEIQLDMEVVPSDAVASEVTSGPI